MDLGEAELPGHADVLDRAQGRGARPAGAAGEVDVVGPGLGDAGRHRPDAPRGDELDADPGRRVDRPQVGDELGEVLDRVDVVVRRRADVGLTGLAAPEGGDVGRRLARRQLAALAGLGALGDLDLELLGPGEVRRRDPEPARRDLLDLGVAAPAVGVRGVPGRVLATLARVRGAAGPLDPDRQDLVGLRRERADAHRADDEPPDDRPGRLDLLEGDGPPPRRRPDRQPIADDGRLGPLEGGPIHRQVGGLGTRGRVAGRQALDRADDPRGEEVELAIRAEPGQARIGQARLVSAGRRRPRWPRWRAVAAARASMAVASSRLASCRSASSRKPTVPCQPRAAGKQRAPTSGARSSVSKNAPPAYEATALMPIRASVLRRPASKASRRLPTVTGTVELLRPSRPGDLGGEPDREPGMDGPGPGCEDHREGMDVEDVRRVGDDVRPAPEARLGQGRVSGAGGEDGRHRRAIEVEGPVGDDDRDGAAPRRADGVGGEPLEGAGQPVRAVGRVPRRVERHDGAGPQPTNAPEQGIEVGDDRPRQPERAAPPRQAAEERRAPSEVDPQVDDEPLPLRIDRGVRDLGEGLLQVVGGPALDPPVARGRRVVTHAPERLVGLEGHRPEVEAEALRVEAGEVPPGGPRVRGSEAARHRPAARRRRRPAAGRASRRAAARAAAGRPRRPGSAAGPARRGASRRGPAASAS